MSSRSRFTPLLFAALVLAGFVIYINLPEEIVESQQQNSATPVKVTAAKVQPFPVTIEALGTANANESVTITAQETETVSGVFFDDGDKVEAGALLVQLNDREEQARIEELTANIEEAHRQLKRVKNLAQSSAASEQLLDEQQARVKALTAQRDVAQAQLTQLQIKAPFSGHLGIRQISKGSLVRPADVITTLDDIAVIKVDFSVAESHLATLTPGQRVATTSVAYPGRVFEGQIRTIDSRLDPVTRSVLVRAQIDNQDALLRPGMLLTVVLEKNVLQALIVPERALVPVQDKQFVYVLNGDTVEQREVTLGQRKPGLVQITGGLDEGEQVITEGTLRVREGSVVRVLNAQEGA